MDPFRDGVWELSLNGEAKGWVTSSVTPMRSFPLLWVKQEQMWTQVHWLGGGHEYTEEDYGPEWYAAEDLRGGRFVAFDPRTDLETSFDAILVAGAERDRLWARLEHGVEPHSRK
ncbi:hypothetical protein [Arthrobacter ginkgonis]|uniref:hypothetical protein n=1 Tax=Arthrobacter ginkgonis TaxID=1630594 RepID=UPI0031E7B5A8